jgi:hypothetical protein
MLVAVPSSRLSTTVMPKAGVRQVSRALRRAHRTSSIFLPADQHPLLLPLSLPPKSTTNTEDKEDDDDDDNEEDEDEDAS